MGSLPTHSWSLPNSISIESQVLSKRLDTLPIFNWQVSLAYATTFLCILLLQYIFKLILCSELSFRGPNLAPHQDLTPLLDFKFSFLSHFMSSCISKIFFLFTCLPHLVGRLRICWRFSADVMTLPKVLYLVWH